MKVVKGNRTNQIAAMQAMLDQIRSANPKFRAIIKQEINKNPKRYKQQDVSKEIIRRLRIQNKKLLEQIASLKDQLKLGKKDKTEIQNRLKHFINLNNQLATALGSCNVCWGEDVECSNCSGNGAPGWRNLNKRLFNIYILPALERLRGVNE